MLYYILRLLLIPFVYLFYWPRVSGLKNIPSEGCVIIYSNHTSLLDPIILGCVLPRRIYFMAKQELFKTPWISSLLNKLGAFPVKRGTADITAIKKSLQILKQGKMFGIFPEGTRNKSGGLQEFSHGIASIAHRSRANAIPIAIFNGYRLFRPIKIIIGQPLDFTDYWEQRTNTEILQNMSSELSNALLNIVNDHTS